MTVSSRNGRLTPDQVQSISFPPARFGRRGLDEETVHSFCDLTANNPAATQYDEKLCRKSYMLMRDFFAETL